MRVEQTREEPSEQGSSRHVTFREVALDEVGHVDEPHYVRAGALVLWITRPTLAGVFATGPQSIADLKVAVALYERLFPAAQRRALLSDARGFGVEQSVFEAMIRDVPSRVAAAGIAPARIGLLLPDDWTRAWWVGLVAMRLLSPSPARAFSSELDAWRWVGGRDDERLAVRELIATCAFPSRVRSELTNLLHADPGLDITRAARLLGSSTRSLQRALSTGGQTFADLKARARVEIVVGLLADTDHKLEAIAASAGFRSRSHFVSWFRRVTGKSPAAFRESQNPKNG